MTESEYVNEATVVGELDETPELRTTRSGTKVANPTVVTRRTWTDKSGDEREGVEYHRVVTWAGLAEKAAEVPTGARVQVTGRLQTRTWEDSDSRKRTTTEIVADSFDVVEEPEPKNDEEDYSDFSSEALMGGDELPF